MQKLFEEIQRYANLNGVPVSTLTQLICECGQTELHLFSDDDEGSATVECPLCQNTFDIQDSTKYARETVQNICNCDNQTLSVAVGISYHAGTTDPKWVYVGANCGICDLSGVYVDWQER